MDGIIESVRLFDCADSQLLGIVHEAPGALTAVVFVAGGGQYRVGSHRLYVQIARRLAANGISAFRFDHRGVGDSTGVFSGFEHLDDDISAAVNTLKLDYPKLERVVVLGLCDGAAAALMAARSLGNIAGLILINPWVHSSGLEAQTRFSSYYVTRLKSREFWEKVVRGNLDIGASSRSFGRYLRELFLATRRRKSGDAPPPYVMRMLDNVQCFDGEMLILLSGQDLVSQQFQQIVTRDRQWKDALDRDGVEIAKLQSADHTFSYAEHRLVAEQKILDWLEIMQASQRSVA